MYLRLPPSDQLVVQEMPDVIDPFTESITQQFPLGAELFYAERKFRYSKNGGTALAVAKLVQQAVPLAGHIDEAVDIPAIGSKTIAFTAAVDPTDAVVVDGLADGYILVNDDTGEGYIYRIKSHPVMPGATSIVITLYDPILVALVAASTATVFYNKYKSLIIHPSPPTALVIGVPVIAVTASYYFWSQVGGICPVLADGTLVINNGVSPSESVDGAVSPQEIVLTEAAPNTLTAAQLRTATNRVGTVVAVNATTEYALIDLAIER
jgi:hypothetical protein